MKDRQQADQQLTWRGLGQLAPLRAHYIVKGLARVVPLNMAFIVGVSQRWYRGVPLHLQRWGVTVTCAYYIGI